MLEIELSPEQAAEAERIADVLRAKMTAEINDIARLLASKSNRELFGATEFQIRDAVHRLGAAGIDAALHERKKGGYQGSSRVCPQCQLDARFQGYRECHITTLLGAAVYERAYYYCPHCHHGECPTDAEFGFVRQQTPGAQEVIALMGLLEPFDAGAHKILPKFTGLNVSTSTVQRTTEDVGRDVAERRAAGETFGPDRVWKWNRDAEGRTVGYISLDATAVPQQGPHAERAEGRMPWVAEVFNPQPTHETVRHRRVGDARYVAGLMSLPDITQQLRRECRAVGLGHVDVIVALSDGGNGLEQALRESVVGLPGRADPQTQSPDIEVVLDFYHVSEHLEEFAKVWLPADVTARQAQLDAWCHTLKQQGGRVLYEQLRSLDLTTAPPVLRAAHENLLGYLRNNLHRMDYPRYVARGWQIGSGMIESACKTVVCRRLKEGGMRWREPGTTALCQLRALHRSEPSVWHNYWARNAAG